MSDPKEDERPPAVDWYMTLKDWSDASTHCLECLGVKYRIDGFWQCPACDRIPRTAGE